jgi:hypothetical protein
MVVLKRLSANKGTATGMVPLAYEAEVTRFSNLAEDDKLPARL